MRSPKYRSFAEDLSTVLQQFEKAKKWPDLVKYMQRVQKVSIS